MSVRLVPTSMPSVDGGIASAPPRLGRYTLLETLGEGAMGVVYRAHDPQLDRRVALKTFRKPACGSVSASVAAALRLRNEAQAAARLSHPGIVAVYEYGEDGEQSFIAMEYVRGKPLLTGMVQPAPLPIDDVLCLMVQLLVALQCAHGQGVWHRDIKPANLMITPEGRLKITDFGIARIDAVALTRDASVMGSPGYLAPECYSAEGECRQVDQRVDLYACGVLLFELLTGVRPFRGSPDVVMYKTLHLPVPPLAAPGDPQFVMLSRFAHVVQRALAKSPDERYASALEMREALTMAAARAVPQALSGAAMRLLMPASGGDVHDHQHASGSGAARGAPAATAAASAPANTPAATAPTPAPTPAPRPTPTAAPRSSPTPFAAAVLARLTAELVDDFGPVAPLVVRRAAAHGDESVSALVIRVANDALPASRRGAFIERMQHVLPLHADADAPRRAAAHPPTGADVPVLDDELRLDPGVLRAAQELVSDHVGPLAAMLVRRASANAATRQQFMTRLADLAAEGQERELLLARLCRMR